MQRELSSILRKTSSKEFTSHEQLLLQYNTHSGYSSILHNRDLLLTVAVYGLVAGSQTCYDTIYPLMLMNPKRFGGFDLDAVTESWISTVGITTQVGTRNTVILFYCSGNLSDMVQIDALSHSVPHFGSDICCNRCIEPTHLLFQ